MSSTLICQHRRRPPLRACRVRQPAKRQTFERIDDRTHHQQWLAYRSTLPDRAAFDFYTHETFWALHWCKCVEAFTVAALLAGLVAQHADIWTSTASDLRASDWW